MTTSRRLPCVAWLALRGLQVEALAGLGEQRRQDHQGRQPHRVFVNIYRSSTPRERADSTGESQHFARAQRSCMAAAWQHS